jgi:glycerate 2-kinase
MNSNFKLQTSNFKMPIAPSDFLQTLFETAVQAALPQRRIQPFLPVPPKGRTIVVGMGKSAAAMARAVEEHWTGPLEGLVVTRYGHQVETHQIEVVEAGHPVPDEQGARAAQRILDWVTPLTEDDLVICLISGGGSALFTLPPAVLTLAELADINQQLLRSGADIVQMNTVRKNLSRSSGGRLAAAAYPAPVVALIISDVPGDSLPAIASGPTVGDTATAREALAIIRQYDIQVSDQVLNYLNQDPDPVILPDDRRLKRTQNILIATPQQSLEAAAQLAQAHGYPTLILGDSLEGEAKDVGLVHAGIAKQVLAHGQPVTPPCVLLSGGETTVTVSGKGGKGGRNSEFLLSFARAMTGRAGVFAIAADTDGIDGSEHNAGALITPEIWQQAQAKGLSASQYLATHDSYRFFEAVDALVVTGPTLTNVNDFRAILISP